MKCVPLPVASEMLHFTTELCLYDTINTDCFSNHFNDLVFTQNVNCVLCEERNSSCVRIYMSVWNV